MAVGRDHVPAWLPNTCWVSRSSSRNGSVRISIASHSFHRRQGAMHEFGDRPNSDICNDNYRLPSLQEVGVAITRMQERCVVGAVGTRVFAGGMAKRWVATDFG